MNIAKLIRDLNQDPTEENRKSRKIAAAKLALLDSKEAYRILFSSWESEQDVVVARQMLDGLFYLRDKGVKHYLPVSAEDITSQLRYKEGEARKRERAAYEASFCRPKKKTEQEEFMSLLLRYLDDEEDLNVRRALIRSIYYLADLGMLPRDIPQQGDLVGPIRQLAAKIEEGMTKPVREACNAACKLGLIPNQKTIDQLYEEFAWESVNNPQADKEYIRNEMLRRLTLLREKGLVPDKLMPEREFIRILNSIPSVSELITKPLQIQHDRIAAAFMLGCIKTVTSAKALMDRLDIESTSDTPSYPLMDAIKDSLFYLKKQGVGIPSLGTEEQLERQLGFEIESRRAGAAYKLGLLATPKSLEILMDRLDVLAEKSLIIAIQNCLEYVKPAKKVEPERPAVIRMDLIDEKEVENLIQELETRPGNTSSMAEEAAALKRKKAAAKLRFSLSQKACNALLERLNQESDNDVCYTIADSLYFMKRNGLRKNPSDINLKNWLNAASNDGKRRVAAFYISYMPVTESADMLLERLDEEADSVVKYMIKESLYDLQRQRVVPSSVPEVKKLTDMPGDKFEGDVIKLALTATEPAFNMLLEYLNTAAPRNDNNLIPRMRAVVRALETFREQGFRSPMRLDTLVEELNNEENHLIRMAAAFKLSFIETEESANALIKRLKEEKESGSSLMYIQKSLIYLSTRGIVPGKLPARDKAGKLLSAKSLSYKRQIGAAMFSLLTDEESISDLLKRFSEETDIDVISSILMALENILTLQELKRTRPRVFTKRKRKQERFPDKKELEKRIKNTQETMAETLRQRPSELNKDARTKAALTLGVFLNQESFDGLFEVWQTEENLSIKETIKKSLYYLRDKGIRPMTLPAMETLIKQLDSESDVKTRKTAAFLLSFETQYSMQAAQALLERVSDEETFAVASTMMGSIYFLDRYLNREKGASITVSEERGDLIELIGKTGLFGQQSWRQTCAYYKLGLIQSQESYDALINRFEAGDNASDYLAFRALDQLRKKGFRPNNLPSQGDLIEQIKSKNARLQVSAAFKLGFYFSQESADALWEFLDETEKVPGNWDELGVVKESLFHLGRQGIIPTALMDEDTKVEYYARVLSSRDITDYRCQIIAYKLGLIGSRKSLKVLLTRVNTSTNSGMSEAIRLILDIMTGDTGLVTAANRESFDVNELVQQLYSPDPEVVKRAAANLKFIPTTGLITALQIRMLQLEDTKEDEALRRPLYDCFDTIEEAVNRGGNKLEEILKDKKAKPVDKKRAAMQMSLIATPYTQERLLNMLRIENLTSPEQGNIEDALFFLREQGIIPKDLRSIDELKTALTDPDLKDNEKIRIAYELGCIYSEESFDVMLEAFRQLEEGTLRYSLGWNLHHLAAKGIKSSKLNSVQANEIKLLQKTPPPRAKRNAVDELILTTHSGSCDALLRALSDGSVYKPRVMEGLNRMREKGVVPTDLSPRPLMETVVSQKPVLGAIFRLGYFPDQETVQKLLFLWADMLALWDDPVMEKEPSYDILKAIRDSLVFIQKQGQVNIPLASEAELESILTSDMAKDYQKIIAAYQLGFISTRKSVEILYRQLEKQENERVLEAILESIQNIINFKLEKGDGDEEEKEEFDVDDLIKQLNSRNEKERRKAAFLLGFALTQKSCNALHARVLKEGTAEVRDDLCRSLENLQRNNILPDYTKKDEEKYINSLNVRDAFGRIRSAILLRFIPSFGNLQALEARLAVEAGEPLVKNAMMDAISSIRKQGFNPGQAPSFDVILQMLEKEKIYSSTYSRAIDFLGRIPSQASLDILLNELKRKAEKERPLGIRDIQKAIEQLVRKGIRPSQIPPEEELIDMLKSTTKKEQQIYAAFLLGFYETRESFNTLWEDLSIQSDEFVLLQIQSSLFRLNKAGIKPSESLDMSTLADNLGSKDLTTEHGRLRAVVKLAFLPGQEVVDLLVSKLNTNDSWWYYDSLMASIEYVVTSMIPEKDLVKEPAPVTIEPADVSARNSVISSLSGDELEINILQKDNKEAYIRAVISLSFLPSNMNFFMLLKQLDSKEIIPESLPFIQDALIYLMQQELAVKAGGDEDKLIAELNDEDAKKEKRIIAAIKLGLSDKSKARQALLDRLDLERENNVRACIQRALSYIAETETLTLPSVKELAKTERTGDSWMGRYSALTKLGLAPTAEAANAVYDILNSESLTRALDLLKEPGQVDLLLRAKQVMNAVRERGFRSNTWLFDKRLIQMLTGEYELLTNNDYTKVWISYLLSFTPTLESADALLERLKEEVSKNEAPWASRDSMYFLGKQGVYPTKLPSMNDLRQMLNRSGEKETRAYAACILGVIPTEESLSLLVARLKRGETDTKTLIAIRDAIINIKSYPDNTEGQAVTPKEDDPKGEGPAEEPPEGDKIPEDLKRQFIAAVEKGDMTREIFQKLDERGITLVDMGRAIGERLPRVKRGEDSVVDISKLRESGDRVIVVSKKGGVRVGRVTSVTVRGDNMDNLGLRAVDGGWGEGFFINDIADVFVVVRGVQRKTRTARSLYEDFRYAVINGNDSGFEALTKRLETEFPKGADVVNRIIKRDAKLVSADASRAKRFTGLKPGDILCRVAQADGKTSYYFGEVIEPKNRQAIVSEFCSIQNGVLTTYGKSKESTWNTALYFIASKEERKSLEPDKQDLRELENDFEFGLKWQDIKLSGAMKRLRRNDICIDTLMRRFGRRIQIEYAGKGRIPVENLLVDDVVAFINKKGKYRIGKITAVQEKEPFECEILLYAPEKEDDPAFQKGENKATISLADYEYIYLISPRIPSNLETEFFQGLAQMDVNKVLRKMKKAGVRLRDFAEQCGKKIPSAGMWYDKYVNLSILRDSEKDKIIVVLKNGDVRVGGVSGRAAGLPGALGFRSYDGKKSATFRTDQIDSIYLMTREGARTKEGAEIKVNFDIGLLLAGAAIASAGTVLLLAGLALINDIIHGVLSHHGSYQRASGRFPRLTRDFESLFYRRYLPEFLSRPFIRFISNRFGESDKDDSVTNTYPQVVPGLNLALPVDKPVESRGAKVQPAVSVDGEASIHSAAVTLLDEATPAPYTFNLKDPEDLTKDMVALILSIILSGKKLVLAFDNTIGEEQKMLYRASVLAVIEKLEELKKESLWAGLLQNLIIIDEKPERLSGKVEDYLGQTGTEVFIFAREQARDNVSALESRPEVNAVYIDESAFKANAYYPLLEIVTITLGQYIHGLDEILENLELLGIDLAELNIKAPIVRESDRVLVFTLLPNAEAYEKQDLIRKYARLKRLLIAA